MQKAEMTYVQQGYATIVADSGIPYPCPQPYDNITSITVAWQEEGRIEQLLRKLQETFIATVVVVQESKDRTLEIARDLRRPLDTVVTDLHYGFGDPSLPRAMSYVYTDWAFKIDCDEWPDQELLNSLGHAIWLADQRPTTNEGIWFPMYEAFDGVRREGNLVHLRLFRSHVTWPGTMHSRPRTEKTLFWPYGYLLHSRSLTEMVEDYLRYLDIGKDNPKWMEANVRMLREACEVVAGDKGWAYVQSHDWWSTLEPIIYKETQPWLSL